MVRARGRARALNPKVNLCLPQGGSMRYAEQSDALVFGCLEDLALHVDAHRAGALIQESKFWSRSRDGMVKHHHKDKH